MQSLEVIFFWLPHLKGGRGGDPPKDTGRPKKNGPFVWGSEIDKVILGMARSGLSSARLAPRCPDWLLSGPGHP